MEWKKKETEDGTEWRIEINGRIGKILRYRFHNNRDYYYWSITNSKLTKMIIAGETDTTLSNIKKIVEGKLLELSIKPIIKKYI